MVCQCFSSGNYYLVFHAQHLCCIIRYNINRNSYANYYSRINHKIFKVNYFVIVTKSLCTVVLNSKDWHKKHSIQILYAYLTRIFAQNLTECLGNTITYCSRYIPLLNATKTITIQSLNFNILKSTNISSASQPARSPATASHS